MTDQPQPTERDRENERHRQAIASRQNDEYAEAMRMALGALGPGFRPWMKLSLIDSDHRKTGNVTPVAVVYKVHRGDEKTSENAVYLHKTPDGKVQKAYGYQTLFGDLLEEPHPTRTVDFRDRKAPVARYELCWSALALYHPKTADQLAALRASRERGKAVREERKFQQDNPLLAWAERQRQEEDGPRGGPSGP